MSVDRGIPFDLAAVFEWDSALIIKDLRRDYGEAGSRRWVRSTGDSLIGGSQPRQ